MQIELLLTLEEYCAGDGAFSGESGHLYTPIFSHILMLLYETEIIQESAFLTWESEKQDDEEDDKVCAPPTSLAYLEIGSALLQQGCWHRVRLLGRQDVACLI